MQEFSSISVSSYEPDALTSQLNEQSAAGWEVVAIIPTGSTVTAYLARDASATAETTDEPDLATAATVAEPQPVSEAETPDDVVPEVVPEPAPEEQPYVVATETAPETAAEPAAETAAAAAPAGWYADPSSRFELRYWDGSTWTEHVSRGGQQFTDPPVA